MTPIFSHMTYRWFLTLLLAMLPTIGGLAQIQEFTVPSDGTVVTTQSLVNGRLYRIIVDGTVSAGTSASCADVDALWAFNIPRSEFDRGHLPNESQVFLGSDSIRTWKSGTISFTFQASKQLGLRMNGRTLPHRELERERHRYMFETMGTGEPLVFQFIDKEYIGLKPIDTLADAYADNCGSFQVSVHDVHPMLQTYCDVSVARRGPQGRVVRLSVPRSLAQSPLFVNGIPTRVDSILCPPLPPPRSTFFLVDRSGSISQRDAESDGVRLQRSEVMDIALRRAFLLLQDTDTISVATFSTRMNTPTAWTTPPRLLADSLDGIPKSATDLYGSLLEMASSVRVSKQRANVVLLSDGGNNFEFDKQAVVTALNNIGGTVGVVLLPDETPEATAANKQSLLDNLQGVRTLRIRDVNSGITTDDALGLLLSDVDLAACCTLVFTIPACESTSFTELATVLLDTLSMTIPIPCTPPIAIDGDVSVRVLPTPSDESATIEITALGMATVSVIVYDLAGKQMSSIDPTKVDPGILTMKFDTRYWAHGVYVVNVIANDSVVSAPLLVFH